MRSLTFAYLRHITLKLGSFTNFKALFPVVLTEFRGRVYCHKRPLWNNVNDIYDQVICTHGMHAIHRSYISTNHTFTRYIESW